MPALKLDQFGGELPAWEASLLPPGQAALSLNGYLFSGELAGWRQPKLLRALDNPAARMVYRIPNITQATAGAVLTFNSNVNEGDTVKVGEEVYTFTATVTDAYDVLIGADANESAANLFAALTLAGVEGTTYGTGTCPNPAISDEPGDNTVVANVITLKAPDFGEAFNATPVTESTAGVRMSWDAPTFTGGLNQSFDSVITGSAAWLEFLDQETNVMRSPVVDDRFNRYYFACPSLPPKYNTYDRIQASQSPWLLGLNPPGCAPGVTVTGGGDQAELGFPTSIVGTIHQPGSNKLILIKVIPEGAMALNTVSIMPAETNATAEFLGVAYRDDAGVPGALLSIGSVVVGCAEDVEIVSTFLNPAPLSADQPYWIGFMSDTAIDYHRANTGLTGYSADATYTNGPPGNAPAMTSGQPNWQMWASLTTSSVLETRAYVYTWLTEYGEESQPSPPTIITGWSNGVWTIDLFTPAADDMGVVRNITHKRLYRTISSVGGQTEYFLVTPEGASADDPEDGNIPILQDVFVDIVLDDVISLNTIMPSTTWSPPPEGLQGILSMPNGMAVGFKGNELWFCEPYRPHAWPAQYILTTEFPIVGIGVTDQSVVAATSGTPYVATGVNPGSMSLTKILFPEPCTARGSILSTDTGVYYASPNGLIQVTQDGKARNMTELWITREKWRELTPPSSLRAIHLASCYFAFGTVLGDDATYAKTGFTIQLAEDSGSFSIWPQPGGHRVGFGRMASPLDFDIYNVQTDPWTGTALLVQNGAIYYYDFSDLAPVMTPYRWLSRKFFQNAAKNFAAMKIYFRVPDGTPAQNPVRNVSPTQPALAADQYGIIRVYGDDTLITTREIRTSGELLRILGESKYEEWQFEIEGRVPISMAQIATSVKELAQT